MEWYENRIESAKNGTNPMLMVEMKSGFAVFGDVQFLPGYCVLLPKREVFSLNDLSISERQQYLADMSLIGDAIMTACNPVRINYDILGNSDKYLHAHIFPRYEWESEERRSKPVWLYDESNWLNGDNDYSPSLHGLIREKISKELIRLVNV